MIFKIQNMNGKIVIFHKSNFLVIGVALALMPSCALAQYLWQETDAEAGKLKLGDNVEWGVEMQGSFSNGKTPLWLNANKYGLSSLERNNGYLRGELIRPLSADSARKWGIGYVVDVAVPVNYTSHLVVQQAFVDVRWLHGVLSVGSKEYPMELKNQTLSSGSQTLGVNARPVPQVRLALPEYWTLPFANSWLQLKGHIAYGIMTDDNWQHEVTGRMHNWTDHLLYHSKAGYLRIGNSGYFCPWSMELGLEMAAEFGGNAHIVRDGNVTVRPTDKSLKGFWHALIPGGADSGEGEYGNVAGNQLGSWLLRLTYDADRWTGHIYADHFFEDHSQMFFLDYDGYGEGEEWLVKKKRRFYRYKLKDMLWGLELNLKYTRWVRNIVFEYIYTKYQSGPYNHDHTMNIPDHLAGMDDYYNHSIYPGWQHWGQVMGNPLFRSPIYNTDGSIKVKNNRFIAYHLGFDGKPTARFAYRALVSYQKGWGTYTEPFTKMHHNVSFLVEGNYQFNKGWQVKAGYGMDFGSEQMLGHNAGFQLTISKYGVFKNKEK